MRTLAIDATADHMLDFLASKGTGGEWSYFADLAEWELLYNLRDERHFVGRLARHLAGRNLAEIRRAALGMQLRLTPDCDELAQQRNREPDQAIGRHQVGPTWRLTVGKNGEKVECRSSGVRNGRSVKDLKAMSLGKLGRPQGQGRQAGRS